MGVANGPPDGRWFERVANRNDTLFYVLRVQPDLAFEYVNDAIEALFGCTVAEALANPAAVLGMVDPAHADRVAQALALPPGDETVVEFTWQHRLGHTVYGSTSARSRQREDGSVVVEGATRDVTQLRSAEVELGHSEKRYRLLVENAWDVVWTTTLDGTLTYVSPSVERLTGVSAAQAIGGWSLERYFPAESIDRLRTYFRGALAAARTGTELPVFRLEHEFVHENGSTLAAEVQLFPLLDDRGQVLEIIGVSRDITERKKLESELRRLAVTDPVTGLWNRRHGEELLAADLSQAQRDRPSLTLLMLDVDNFKAINDSRGHQAGDRVLVEISRRLAAVSRDTDMVIRWGGEEFVILLRDCAVDEGMNVAEDIRATIADTPFIETGIVTASIGVAQAGPQDDLTSWVARADNALYAAKRSGRNTVELAK
jgi:diguanylate cyclase (GGDEF)-like protein/PAS domain S-box-containing protein